MSEAYEGRKIITQLSEKVFFWVLFCQKNYGPAITLLTRLPFGYTNHFGLVFYTKVARWIWTAVYPLIIAFCACQQPQKPPFILGFSSLG